MEEIAAYFEPTIGGIIAAIGLLMAIPPFVTRTSSEFGVTSRRVVIKAGVVRRRTLELLLRQIEAIAVDQSIMGRLFGYGSITVMGTGGVRETFNDIARARWNSAAPFMVNVSANRRGPYRGRVALRVGNPGHCSNM